MAGKQDAESGNGNGVLIQRDILTPLIVKQDCEHGDSLWMVLLCTFVAVCGSFQIGCVMGYSAPTQSAITDHLGLSLSQYSVFGSAPTVGAMIGAMTSGSIADCIGRKGAMRISSVFCFAGWLAIYFATYGVIALDIGRLSSGCGMGLLSYAVPVFVSEIAPENLRGGLATLNQLMMTSGVSFALIVGTITSWRTLAFIGMIPCFVLFFGLFFIPESPRWLAKIGYENEFGIALQKLRGSNADVSFEATEILEYMDTLKHLPKSKMTDLFQRRYMLSLTICVGLMLIQQLGGIKGISFYVSYIFESAGFPSHLGTIIYGCSQIPTTAVGALLIDKAGRRPLLLVSASGLVIGSLLVATSFFMKVHELSLEYVPILALFGVMTFAGSFGVGMGAIPWVIMAEILPINIKGTAGSLISLVNWFASWIVTLSFNFLLSWNSYGTFIIFAAVNVVGILFVAKLVPETKGRTLEDIQVSLKKK